MLGRLDKAVIPAGLIRSAKTYSLVLETDGLYIIHTGPAGRHVRTRDTLSNAVANMVHNNQALKLAEGEKRLDSVSLVELVKEKGNTFITRGEIKGVEVGKNIYEETTMTINTEQKKWKFHFFFQASEEQVRKFAALFF